jgi:hypothetical protein
MENTRLVAERIQELDLEPIKFKLAKDEGYSHQEIAVIDLWYRRFLFLGWKYSDRPIVVPKPIDAMWHHHILDTRKYAEDCKAAFGQFLHHFPYFGVRGDDDARALRAAFFQTKELMQKEFGENASDALADLRAEWSSEEAASSCSDCSSMWAVSILPDGEIRPRLG